MLTRIRVRKKSLESVLAILKEVSERGREGERRRRRKEEGGGETEEEREGK